VKLSDFLEHLVSAGLMAKTGDGDYILLGNDPLMAYQPVGEDKEVGAPHTAKGIRFEPQEFDEGNPISLGSTLWTFIEES
jgi:hypothetical protein